MKHLKTFNEFNGIKEDAVTGQDSKVVVDDIYIAKLDRELKGAEILGAIKAAETEGEFKDYFYSEYGNSTFDTAEMSQLLKFYNGYEEEANAEEAEAEAEEEEGGGEGEGEGEDDLDMDIDI